ncbi:MAG TPA: hypothetical protein VF499_04635 [Afipia sp.]
MTQFYSNESIFQALFVTLVLGGGCALLAGRAIALTWRSIWIAILAMIPMGLAVRFVHFALFNETLVQPSAYVAETAILIAAACLSFQRTRAQQMVRQYYWLYEPSGPLGWRLRQDAPAKA